MSASDGDHRRTVVHQWVRDPEGDWLPRPPPSGLRTPNNLIWGHEPGDFYHIYRKPGISVITLWSRSMIMEFGKDHPSEIAPHTYEEEMARQEKPRLRKPWPVLKVRRGIKMSPPLDAMDEGSDHEDDEDGTYEVLPSSWDAEDERGPKGFEELARGADAGDPFALDAIPKLEQFIPEQYFPDYILVHDPDDVCSGLRPDYLTRTPEGAPADLPAPKRYKRVFPTDETLRASASTQARAGDRPNVAHVYVNKNGVMGEGHHSLAYRASVRLPYPLSARSPNKQVTLAMKVAMPQRSARDMLETEAVTYSKFPRHLMEDWCGYNLLSPEHGFPVPATAVVPKFFGYYKPELDDVDVEDEDDNRYRGSGQYDGVTYRSHRNRVATSSSPILLMEDCGVPIIPKSFDMDARTEIFSLAIRLHFEGFVQNSFFTRNILMQPGPLTLPPALRSVARPSFRVIDFGRAEIWDDLHQAAFAGRTFKDLKEGAKEDENMAEEKKADGKPTEEEIILNRLGTEWWDKRRKEKELAQSELAIDFLARKM